MRLIASDFALANNRSGGGIEKELIGPEEPPPVKGLEVQTNGTEGELPVRKAEVRDHLANILSEAPGGDVVEGTVKSTEQDAMPLAIAEDETDRATGGVVDLEKTTALGLGGQRRMCAMERVNLKERRQLDDVVKAVYVHGTGGLAVEGVPGELKAVGVGEQLAEVMLQRYVVRLLPAGDIRLFRRKVV